MFPMKWLAGFVFGTASVVLLAPTAQAEKRVAAFASDDDAFLALRDAARNNDAARAEEIASRLGNYEIPSYVDYFRLKPRIDTAPESEIRAFLQRYAGSAIADRLRNDWLLALGKAGNWQLFDEQYPQFVLNDDTQVKCYALTSRALKGEDVADEARVVLHSPQYYGEACPLLINTLVQAHQFDADDVWAQVRLVTESGYSGTLRRIADVTGVSERELMRLWEHPARILKHGPGRSAAEHQLFIAALSREARKDPERAADALSSAESRLNPGERALGGAQVALQAAIELAPEAESFWLKADGAPLTEDGYQWRVRAAMLAGAWKQVRTAIEVMPATLRNDPAWIYWLGRAYKAEGDEAQARQRFEAIADQTNFYGQLALEELGRKITIPPRAQPVTDAEIAPMAANPGFKRALKFFDLDMRFEGYREWNWELRSMNERQYLAAAEYARRKNVLDRMVSTSDRTRKEVDFTQRFPSPFHDTMLPATRKLGLDIAWVYGLIRQESRFIHNVRSNVGASGLMQLMPSTARYVAKKIGLSDYSHQQVNDIDTNILLGTSYLDMVLNDLGGSQALATAAYNAGPRRARQWRACLPHAVEGAIFAESIPFSETRDYVKKVLSNATYYAALFDGEPQSLKARLGVVAPASEIAGDTLP